ncbi:DUF3040 domain-containing protein [Arthrobacter glacialis]|nr:DUF3040 domain-containing protein [Arthrobacter glacialis]
MASQLIDDLGKLGTRRAPDPRGTDDVARTLTSTDAYGPDLKEVVMPLSEHEQRLLDQLEQQLHAEDPKFANVLSTSPSRSLSTRNIVIGVLVVIIGLMILLGGVASQLIVVGILGFLVMGAGVYLAISKPKFGADPQRVGKAGGNAGAKPKSGFMNNLEEKWDERRREQ